MYLIVSFESAFAQKKKEVVLKLYPFSLPSSAKVDVEYKLNKKLYLIANASGYYEKTAKGGGRSSGIMGGLYLNCYLADIKPNIPFKIYIGGGGYSMNTGYTYNYERWDYDKNTGREISYVPFSSVFGGKWSTVAISKNNGFYGEIGLMGSLPLDFAKHFSIGWRAGYRINHVDKKVLNLSTENQDQFDYKWYKLHMAYSPSLNKYYYTAGIGTGFKMNVSINYTF